MSSSTAVPLWVLAAATVLLAPGCAGPGTAPSEWRVQALTNNDRADILAMISYSGRQVAFHRWDGNDWEMFITAADGSLERQLTDNQVNEVDPAITFSDDLVVFYRAEEKTLIAREVESGREHALDDFPPPPTWPDPVPDPNPSEVMQWAEPAPGPWPIPPGDGPQAFYNAWDGNDLEIFLARAGRRVTRITDNEVLDRCAFGRFIDETGTRIVFESRIGPGDTGEIVLASLADGVPKLRRLTENAADEQRPVISGDGRRVAVSRQVETGDYDVFLHDIESGATRRLTDLPGRDINLMMDREGRHVVFQHWDGHDWEIFIADDRGRITQITDNEGDDVFPSLDRTGTVIAFTGFDGRDWEIMLARRR